MGSADDTIDHFKPKSNQNYHNQAYRWENLYLACADCQKDKVQKFNDLLLAPDAEDYAFERYFIYNFHTHEIEINPGLSESDTNRALVTKDEIFNFNDPNRVVARRAAYERWFSPLAAQVLDDFPFRFIFDCSVSD
jgi:uncharacterized protein (TIGR02646 family)